MDHNLKKFKGEIIVKKNKVEKANISGNLILIISLFIQQIRLMEKNNYNIF